MRKNADKKVAKRQDIVLVLAGVALAYTGGMLANFANFVGFTGILLSIAAGGMLLLSFLGKKGEVNSPYIPPIRAAMVPAFVSIPMLLSYFSWQEAPNEDIATIFLVPLVSVAFLTIGFMLLLTARGKETNGEGHVSQR